MKFTWAAVDSSDRETGGGGGNDKYEFKKCYFCEEKRQYYFNSFFTIFLTNYILSHKMNLFWFNLVDVFILFISFHLDHRTSHPQTCFFFLSMLFVWQVPKHSLALFSWCHCINNMTKSIKEDSNDKNRNYANFSCKLSHRLQWCMQTNLNTFMIKNDQINSIYSFTTEECTMK